MKKNLLITSMLFLFLGAISQNIVLGPNGRLKVELQERNGAPIYSVSYNGNQFIKESPLGLITNIGDFSTGLSLSGEIIHQKITDSYSLPNIKKSQVSYHANEAIFSFFKDEQKVLDIIFRVSNNDIAFKYMIHQQGEPHVCIVTEEKTGYLFPSGTTTFLSPQMEPMTAFARTAPSYETAYTGDEEMGKNGRGYGYVFPALFKVNNFGWVLISETGVDSRYCASRLIGHDNGLYTIGYPMAEENNSNGTSSPGIGLPGYTPWRTITVGENLNPIVETTIPFDVVKPLYKTSKAYEFGRGSWSWIIKMDDNTTFDVQKEYIDFSAAMGYEYVLVDALWDVQIGREKIKGLSAYAAEKNVSLFLWYNSNGYWNDAPQGPKDLMHVPAARRLEMQWMQELGIKGIKVDFFGGDKQVTMQLYEDILYDANDFGLLVVFHGCTLPRGWERMFPNYASSEAVLASEMLHFSQERCDTEAIQASMHPFLRNTVGSMDFGGTVLNQFWNTNNAPNQGTKRLTSDVFQLATSIIFQSSIQFFALAPNNLTDAPKWAIDFMKDVPTTWDEIKYIDGYPGKYAILARKSKDKWYLAAINAGEQAIKTKIELPMFNAGDEIMIYSDDAKLNGSLKTQKLNRKRELNIEIPQNGGLIITK